MALFNFRLLPLDQVAVWGPEGEPALHWFGLSDGEFWINAGDQRLLEYSDAVVTKRGFPRVVSYPVAAFYDAVVDTCVSAFTPVPDRLQHHLSPQGLTAWDKLWSRWHPVSKADDDLVDQCLWMYQRRIDLGYLTERPSIFIWSTRDEGRLTWIADDSTFEGMPLWSATRGEIVMPLERLRAEITDFHERYLEAMTIRCEAVKRGARGDASIDFAGLDAALNSHHRTSWSQMFGGAYDPPDWPAIESDMRHVEQAAA